MRGKTGFMHRSGTGSSGSGAFFTPVPYRMSFPAYDSMRSRRARHASHDAEIPAAPWYAPASYP